MNDIREDLKAFIDGELPEARAREVETAIASDPALLQEVHVMRMLGLEIKRAASEPEVTGATETLAKLRKPRFSFLRLPVLPTAIGTLAIIGIAMIVYPLTQGAMESAKSETTDAKLPAAARKMVGADAKSSGFNPTTNEGLNDGGGQGDQVEAQDSGSSTSSTPPMGGGSAQTAAPMSEKQDFAKREALSSPGDARALAKNPTVAYRDMSPTDKGGAGGVKMDNYNHTLDSRGTTTPSEVLHKEPKLVRNAEMSVKVPDVQKAQDKIIDVAKKLHGFLSNTNLTTGVDKVPECTVAFRVPVENFDAALIEIRSMGQVISENSKSDDVTAPLADQESRLVTLADQEKSLIAELEKTKDQNRKWQIRNRIADLRTELASIKAQYKALRDIADYSTINLTFRGGPQSEDPKVGESWSGDTWTSAVNGSKGIGRFFGAIGIYLLAYAPFWLPILFIGWLIARKRSA
jgi:hypothetical protein